MPLTMIEIRDLVPFIEAWGTNVAVPNKVNSAGDGTQGFSFYNGMGSVIANAYNTPGYLHIADQLLMWNDQLIRDATTYWVDGATRCDSQGIDSLSGHFTDDWPGSQTLIPTITVRYHMGQAKLESGIQRVFAYQNTGITPSPGWLEIDINTLSYNNTAIFQNYDPEGSQVASGNDGWYDMSNAVSLTPRYLGNGIDQRNLIIFDGITDSTGYSEITDGGTNIHAEGLSLQRVDDCRLSGTEINAAWIWVDVDTGNAVGYLDVPYDTAGTDGSGAGDAGQQSEPNLDGKSFNWSRVQFVPDEDSLDAQPKGELHFFSGVAGTGAYGDYAFEVNGNFTDVAATAFTGYRQFVSVVEFNPFGLTTGTLRTHNRRTFLGAIDVPADPTLPGGPTVTLTGGNLDRPNTSIYYHQPSRSYFLWNGWTDNNVAGSPIEVMPGDDSWALLRWSRGFVVDSILTTPISVVATNKTVRHEAIVYAEFSQKAPGVALTATLSRVSTYSEQFTPATTTAVYTVEADEIDDNETLEVWEGDVGTGTLLTETTNYTVNYGTGTITGVNFTASTVHSLVYQHRNVPLTPPHGTLLNGSATTDENGIALFDVKYADDATLENMIDELVITDV